MWEYAGAAVALISLVASAITAVAALALRNAILSVENNLLEKITEKITEARTEIDKRIANFVTDFDDKIERQRRETGEVANALRAKIHEVETWSRDNFVRRDSFERVIESISTVMTALGERLEKRLERMEGKIDMKANKDEG